MQKRLVRVVVWGTAALMIGFGLAFGSANPPTTYADHPTPTPAYYNPGGSGSGGGGG